MAGKKEDLSNKFFELCRTYFEQPEQSFRQCAAEMGYTHTTFMRAVKTAFRHGYLVLKGPPDHATSQSLNRALSAVAPNQRHIETHVVRGEIDDDSFACSAAERVLTLLRGVLQDNTKREINLGLVSGSTTMRTVKRLAEGRFWEELLHDVEIENKKINIMALNISPVFHGEELLYNAVNTVLLLYTWLKEKLASSKGCEVTPYQLSSTYVVKKSKVEETDRISANKHVLQYADPGRVEGNPPDSPSKLDMVITSVGGPADSLLQKVIQAEKLEIDGPQGAFAGDLLFFPLDANGAELALKRASGKEDYLIYSALGLQTIKRMVEGGRAKVVLIARDRRMGREIDKSKAILAATRGGFFNELITDVATAAKLQRLAGRAGRGESGS